MKSATAEREILSSGDLVTGTFGISHVDEAHIMGILRDGLYSDKIMAVLREYSSNAWDAHREALKGDTPIRVHMPTDLEPTFTVRDWGLGLSEEDVFTTYTKYGKSTKRDTNDAVGMLGIGCKSGFAYSETFTVTSWHGGMKKIYIAVLDPSDRGLMNKIHEEPCGEETGVEIQIPVRAADIQEFARKGQTLFRYFDPRPEINLPLPPDQWNKMPSGFLSEANKVITAHPWVAVMGCVPYRIDLSQVQEEMAAEPEMRESIGMLHGGLYFDIGEVRISANREELKYTEQTKQAIIGKLRSLFDEYVTDTLQTLEDPKLRGWEKRTKALFLSQQIRIPLPKKYQPFLQKEVLLWSGETKKPHPKTFSLYRNSNGVCSLRVNDFARLLYRDSPKNLQGFDTTSSDTIILPREKATREEVEAELLEYLREADVEDIPRQDLSTLTWTPSTWGRSRTDNPKHRVNQFRLKNQRSYFCSEVSSENWEVISREPTDDDIFVILSSFKVVGHDGFYATYEKDKAMAKAMGVQIPEVYGYKTTSRNPIKREDVQGTHYMAWRKAFFRKAMTFKWKELVRLTEWAESFYPVVNHWSRRNNIARMHTLRLLTEKELGPKHTLVHLLKKAENAHVKLEKVKDEDRRHLTFLAQTVRVYKSAPIKALEDFYAAYPLLLPVGRGLHALEGEHHSLWMEYIKTIDKVRENKR